MVSQTPHEPSEESASGDDRAADQREAGAGTNDADEAGHPEDGDRASEQTRQPPASLTFRITPISLFAVITVAICVTPMAWVAAWLLSLYAIPVLLLVWVLRCRTVVDADQLSVRTMLRSTTVPWDEVRSLHLDERRWLRAVLVSGKKIRLPSVRVRDLPRLSAMSGGRLPDPATAESPANGSDSAEK